MGRSTEEQLLFKKRKKSIKSVVWVFYGVVAGGWEDLVFMALTSDLKDVFRVFVSQLVNFTLLWFLSLIIFLYWHQPTPWDGLCSAVVSPWSSELCSAHASYFAPFWIQIRTGLVPDLWPKRNGTALTAPQASYRYQSPSLTENWTLVLFKYWPKRPMSWSTFHTLIRLCFVIVLSWI